MCIRDRIKRSVVEEDEFEKGNRALLNLGHTFGHAIEGYLNYDGTILHGEAVSIGIIMALKLSVKMGYCSKNDYERVLEHFNVVGLPTSMKLYIDKIIDPLKLWKIMQNDKKMYKNHQKCGGVSETVFDKGSSYPEIEEKGVAPLESTVSQL